MMSKTVIPGIDFYCPCCPICTLVLSSEQIDEWEKLVARGIESRERHLTCLRGHELELHLACGFSDM